MSTNHKLNASAAKIADAIIDLVEKAGGPVTLARITTDVPGFAEQVGPAWEYVVDHADGRATIWTGMTEEGYSALREVIGGRRVAVQPVPFWFYLVEDSICTAENWLPLVLRPASVANIECGRWLLHIPPNQQKGMMELAAAKNILPYRHIAPRAA